MTALAPQRSRRRLLRKLLFVVLTNVFLLALLEGLVGVLGPPYEVRVVRQEKLARAKQPGEKRVFLYGESTIFGWPYGPDNSTARWLDRVLRDVLPAQQVRCVNFGRPGRGTYHLRYALENTLAYEPDAVVLCVGHNEFLPYSHPFVQSSTHRWLFFHSHLYRNIHEAQLRFRSKRDGHFYCCGIPVDTPLHQDILTNYRRQMHHMLAVATRKGVPALVCVPGCNLADHVPARTTNYPTTQRGWDELVRTHALGCPPSSTAELLRLSQSLHTLGCEAESAFARGRALEAEGRHDEAYAAFSRARDQERISNRCKTEQIAVLRELSQQYGAPIVDFPDLFRRLAAGRAPGRDLFHDAMHPRPEGQYRMAEAIARALCAAGWLAPAEAWHWDNLPSFETCAAEVIAADECRRTDREALCGVLQRDAVAAYALARHPPVLAGQEDPEWMAFQVLCLWRAGLPERARATWQALSPMKQAGLRQATRPWPSQAQQWWQEMERGL
jgi:lysophospholipase L1-like esterase